MPLFRFHKGTLEESLKTTIIVNSYTDMVAKVIASFDQDFIGWMDWHPKFEILPYPNKKYNFDARTGWYTHMVVANLYEADILHPIGYLSEPFYIKENNINE